MIEDIVIRGAEIKLNIHIDPIDGVTMDDYDFFCEAFVQPAKNIITVRKSDMKRVDESNYIMLIDTLKLSSGKLCIKVVASVPDGDFDDHIRTEVSCIHTNINIKKC